MIFAYDTEVALATAVALINTASNGGETLKATGDLADFLRRFEYGGRSDGTLAELEDVHELRSVLADLWQQPEDILVERVNAILRDHAALPQLVKHDNWDWHIHASSLDAPLPTRMALEAAMGLADLVRGKELRRMGQCSSPECDAVFIDLTKNRSRLYCDTGNCANRAHAAAYRARRNA